MFITTIIGTSIVLSFQLFIILLLTMVLLSSNLMDLIYSLPSINIERIHKLIDHLIIEKCINYLKSVYSWAINGITDSFGKCYFLNSIGELYSRFTSNCKNIKCFITSRINQTIDALKNITEKIQALIENIGRFGEQIINKINSCGQKLCEIGKENFIKAKSIGLTIKERAAGKL